MVGLRFGHVGVGISIPLCFLPPQHLQHWAGAGGQEDSDPKRPHAQVDSVGMSLPVQLGPGAHGCGGSRVPGAALGT